MRILAIETSCDETAAAIVRKDDTSPFVHNEVAIIVTQASIHEKYGGVYPEVASREHIKKILVALAEALDLPTSQQDRLPDFRLAHIDYIAVTQGPGLIGSLLVGVQTAATLSYVTGIPLLPVNHLAGHIYAAFVRSPYPPDAICQSMTKREVAQYEQPVPEFPLMALVVSGGHTMLIRMEEHHAYQLLGQTRDDAVGEAFDKVAKLLDLGYPGGPRISELAKKGDRFAYKFPIGLEHEASLDFSYSGLKTAVLREVQALGDKISSQDKANIAASFERVAIESLLLKTTKALEQWPVKHFILGGGVAANTYLRDRLESLLVHKFPDVTLHKPTIALSTDNATVIGAAAAFGDLQPIDPLQLEARARFPLVTHS